MTVVMALAGPAGIETRDQTRDQDAARRPRTDGNGWVARRDVTGNVRGDLSPGKRFETAAWVLTTERSQVQILLPLRKTAGERPFLSEEGPLALPPSDQIRDRPSPIRASERETRGNAHDGLGRSTGAETALAG
jgi:hypothetical protein